MATSGRSRPLRRRAAVWATAAIAIGIGVACTSLTAPVRAAIVNFSATVDGPQVPTVSLAVWSGSFVMDTVANTLSVTVTDTLVAPLLGPEIAAHIHGFAPPGMPAGILFGLPVGSPKIAVWNFMEAQEPSIIAGLTYVNIHTTVNPNGEIRGQILRVPGCGDGILDGGEQCDDGNTADGDCCDSACQFEAAASDCGDGLCEAGTCDGAGSCVGGGTPRTNCRGSLKSLLLIKNSASDDNKDKLVFKWIKGEATTLEDFGVPTGTTTYALCLYAGTTAVSAVVPPSLSFWSPTGTKGFKYKDKTGSADGIQKILLKSGVADKAKTLVKGKGTDLPDLPDGELDLPVIAQLVSDANAVCYEGVFDMNAVIKNQPELFKAKNK
jgi:cysteine-rich repeat protein